MTGEGGCPETQHNCSPWCERTETPPPRLHLPKLLPPFEQRLDEGSVALGGCEVQKGHSPERLRVDQVFGFGPASSAHHLLAHHHNAALKAGAQGGGLRDALQGRD